LIGNVKLSVTIAVKPTKSPSSNSATKSAICWGRCLTKVSSFLEWREPIKNTAPRIFDGDVTILAPKRGNYFAAAMNELDAQHRLDINVIKA
jgi:hypothetical protein